MTAQATADPFIWTLRLPRPVRLIAWAVMVGVTVAAARDVSVAVAGGVLMAVAAAGIQVSVLRFERLRGVGALVAAACGLAVIPLIPAGLGVIPVLVAVIRFPSALPPRLCRIAAVLAMLGFGAAIGWISRSVAGALAGLVVPLLVQRAEEHRQLVAERDRARALLAELQATREAEAQAAALRERGRIARDMHDVLAHSLAALSLQLQAARAVAAQHGDVLGPLDKAADLARDGLAEARAAVSALRDPVGLALADVPALVDRHPGDARLVVDGSPASVGPEAGHAVYRAVQEALTNAARYAPGAPVLVTLAWTPHRLTVTIADTGRPRDREPVPSQGTGLGLPGMDERIRSVGGTLQAGPRADGGWQVEMQVPTE